ncbi:MAG: aspartate aminotransferase family protein [Gammaproteobacteria bacterium]|nr:aspartate aminotransferase family protein [Gammaproteobacteria bacterium]
MPDTLMNTYARLPVTFERGEGAWLWDTEGKQYIDALCGIAVTGLGHAHPQITQAICEQAGQLMHTTNLFGIKYQQMLGDQLAKLSGMENCFFANSGAEANEAAIKIARLHAHHRGVEDPAIVVTENSFHGRTLATLSATGSRKVQAGFEPLVKGFLRVPYNDLQAIENIAKHHKNVVGVLVEPVQGESGIQIPDADYLSGVRAICDNHQWLMMLDEIQTGMGRSGKWFAFQHFDFLPDIMTLAKGLGNGFPIGVCIARGEAAKTFQPGKHGTTFGGNPLACRTALEVIKVIEQNNLVSRAAELGERLLGGLKANLQSLPQVKQVRGKGLLLAVELNAPCTTLAKEALDNGIVINVTNSNVIRILPPLIISNEEADVIVEKITTVVKNFTP